MSLEADLLTVDEHKLKNGWLLLVNEHNGRYEIHKSGVLHIMAIRVTGDGFGDGIWTIKYTTDSGMTYECMNVIGGFTNEACDSVIDTMEALMDKYDIKDYYNIPIKVKALTLIERIKTAVKRIFGGGGRELNE